MSQLTRNIASTSVSMSDIKGQIEMLQASSPVSGNLKLLCSEYPSVAEVCRRIGINRQQFNKYLSGTALPSKRNTARICAFFGLSVSDLALSEHEFAILHQQRKHPLLPAALKLRGTQELNPEAKTELERYCGYYQTYQKIPYAKECIVVGVGQIRRVGNHFASKHIELLQGHVRSELSLRGAKMYGTVVIEGGLLYILDHKSGTNPGYSMTTLYPSRSPEVHLVTGMTLSVSGMLHGSPYAANIVYEKLPEDVNLMQIVRNSGIYEMDAAFVSDEIKHIINNTIRSDQHVLWHNFF